ncbi:MAG: monovalent cation/H(+) antiporter subunit G [Rhizobiaceae bacterium]|nr:monovalent cation/H(+) antiporter subunit G [Rhizobiaceae bacterium]
MIEALVDIVVGLMIVVGAAFSLAAAIGINRLPDVYSRMHAASKAGTLGSGVILLALALHADDAATVMRAVAGFVFLLLTAPIAAHLLAKASYEAGYRLWDKSVKDELILRIRDEKEAREHRLEQ